MNSNISTNGTHIDILHRLSERYDRERLRIGISLHNHDVPAELHAYIMKHKPAVKSVVTRNCMMPQSFERYLDIPEIAYFLIFMDVLSDRDLANSMPFSRFYNAITQLKIIHPGLAGVFCSGFIIEEDDALLKSLRCPAGTTKLSIAPDGSVYPCYLFFPYKEFVIGNILRDDFPTMLQNPLLNYFRTFSDNQCPDARCTLSQACHGGCPAMSYRFYGKLDAPDPRCRTDREGEYSC